MDGIILESISVRDLIRRSLPPPVKPIPLVKNDGDGAEIKQKAPRKGKEKRYQ
jgi:hypothetical protein